MGKILMERISSRDFNVVIKKALKRKKIFGVGERKCRKIF
jgi:hypothetical protein